MVIKMNEEKEQLTQSLSDLQARKEAAERKDYGPLIEEAETLLQQYAAKEAEIDARLLARLYFLTAELLFGSDLALRAQTHSRELANESKTLAYYNKAVELDDIEEYSYELWNFLSSAGHKQEGIAALERFIERTGGTAKVLSRAAEYVLMYADSEDAEAIQKSVDYFHRAVEMAPDRYETYWAYWTDLEEAIDVCPRLFEEALLCLDRLIALSLPADSENHDSLANRYFDLALVHIKLGAYEKAAEAAGNGLAVDAYSNYGTGLMIQALTGMNRFEEALPYCQNRLQALLSEGTVDQRLAEAFFDLAHCCHMTGQPGLASKYYLAFENGQNIVPQKYRNEYLLYYKRSRSLLGRIKALLAKILKR